MSSRRPGKVSGRGALPLRQFVVHTPCSSGCPGLFLPTSKLRRPSHPRKKKKNTKKPQTAINVIKQECPSVSSTRAQCRQSSRKRVSRSRPWSLCRPLPLDKSSHPDPARPAAIILRSVSMGKGAKAAPSGHSTRRGVKAATKREKKKKKKRDPGAYRVFQAPKGILRPNSGASQEERSGAAQGKGPPLAEQPRRVRSAASALGVLSSSAKRPPGAVGEVPPTRRGLRGRGLVVGAVGGGAGRRRSPRRLRSPLLGRRSAVLLCSLGSLRPPARSLCLSLELLQRVR